MHMSRAPQPRAMPPHPLPTTTTFYSSTPPPPPSHRSLPTLRRRRLCTSPVPDGCWGGSHPSRCLVLSSPTHLVVTPHSASHLASRRYLRAAYSSPLVGENGCLRRGCGQGRLDRASPWTGTTRCSRDVATTCTKMGGSGGIVSILCRASVSPLAESPPDRCLVRSSGMLRCAQCGSVASCHGVLTQPRRVFTALCIPGPPHRASAAASTSSGLHEITRPPSDVAFDHPSLTAMSSFPSDLPLGC